MNILAIGAHFDDIELGCSGTLINHVKKGDRVIVMVITNSEYSSQDGAVFRSREVAYTEGKHAADIIGADKLICLDKDTFTVAYDDPLVLEIIKVLDKFDIDTVYTHWVHDIHRDHQMTANSSMMACRHVPRFLMYRSNYYDANTSFRGNFYSDITEVIETKKEAILAHESELTRVDNAWLKFFMNQNANDGQKIGVQYAEAFEIVRYLI